MLILHRSLRVRITGCNLPQGCAHRHAVKQFPIAVKEDNRKNCDESQPVDFGNECAIAGNSPK